METIIVAVIAAVPTTVASLAAWRNTRSNGRGPLHVMLADVQDRQARQDLHLRDLLRWQVDHLSDHNRNPN
jgi:hypothetical protein